MFLISGLILLLAGSSWFAGAGTVGWILLGVGALKVLIRGIMLYLLISDV